MMENTATVEPEIRLMETLPVVGLLLGGVPTLTILVMAACHYVVNGSL